ncbi:MAG: DUF488 domain-containing protein [Bryobacterales bacterium]|nr:DUF488 domain-containing protein [Bryobacterales bacterium]
MAVAYTIGHSNHSLERFVELLRQFEVDVVADTRSQPHSSFCPHFNRESVKSWLEKSGIRYVYMGKELGGRPEGKQFYDPEGHVFYGKVADADFFLRGIERLERGLSRYRGIALLCSEENPSVCHRRLLIARVLTSRGIQVHHIRGDGSLQSEQELLAAEEAAQLSLFERDAWKSIPSVLPKKQRDSSSKPSETPVFAASSTSV